MFEKFRRLPLHLNVSICFFQGRAYQCDKCGKSYNRLNSYLKHARVHDDVRPFLCPICAKTFVYKDSLNQHLLTHTDAANEICPTCGKNFKHRGSLNKHMRMHGPARFACGFCDRRFDRKEYLLAHTNTHIGKQQCSACNASVFHLDKHICKKERGEPKYQCQTCNKKFREKRYLWEHTKYSHKQTSSFGCQKCGKAFNYRSGLYNHKKQCELQT